MNFTEHWRQTWRWNLNQFLSFNKRFGTLMMFAMIMKMPKPTNYPFHFISPYWSQKVTACLYLKMFVLYVHTFRLVLYVQDNWWQVWTLFIFAISDLQVQVVHTFRFGMFSPWRRLPLIFLANKPSHQAWYQNDTDALLNIILSFYHFKHYKLRHCAIV